MPSQTDPQRIPAVVLAGGRATRMGGGDKGLRRIAGRTLLDHVLGRLIPQAGAVALNANGPPARFAPLGLPVIADSIAGFQGPLAGVLAGLDWAAELGAPCIVTVAADTPFFPRDLVARLAEAAGPTPIALAATPGPDGRLHRHPTFALWSTDLRDDLRASLAEGKRKVTLWAESHGAVDVPFDMPHGFDPFFNVNTPEDLLRAEALALRL